MGPAVFILFFASAWAALPPGYEDEIYCPEGFCLADRTNLKPGLTGPRTLFLECRSPWETRRPVGWGDKVGAEFKQQLISNGFHTLRCEPTTLSQKLELTVDRLLLHFI